jgi:hypothetical protein
MMTARMHVNGYPSLLDEVLRFYSTGLDGSQRQGFRSFGHYGQTDGSDGSTT